MVYDIEMLRSFYSSFPKRVDIAREKIGRPMTLAEKSYMLIYMMKMHCACSDVATIM